MRSILAFALTLFTFALTAQAQHTFEVDSWSDDEDLTPGDGVCQTVNLECTLRAAIEEANATPNDGGADNIYFTNIPILSWFASIQVYDDELPLITEKVNIDGTTSAGLVILDGSANTRSHANGIRLSNGSGGSTIKGLCIANFSGSGIYIGSEHNKIESNYIGVASDGTNLGNGQHGIMVYGSFNSIGGIDKGNVIGYNGQVGVYLPSGSDNNLVRGNYIGTDVAGNNLGNLQDGVVVIGNENTIGGLTSEQGNTIGFNRIGIALKGMGEDNTVRNNYIGTNSFSQNLGNLAMGILILDAYDNVIGGRTPYGNVIGFNQYGMVVETYAANNKIRGNYIGVGRSGENIGNQGAGIQLNDYNTSNNVIGYGANVSIPADSPRANSIAFNQGPGISVTNLFLSSAQVSIRGNKIYENDEIAIDLQEDGATPNDSDDGDTGVNGLQNYPDIIQAGYNGSFNVIAVEFSVSSDSTIVSYPLHVDVYIADDAASGEGKTHLGTEVYDTPGEVVRFELEADDISWSPDDVLVLTATDADGNTSEFSPVSEELGGPGNTLSIAGQLDVLKRQQETPTDFNLSQAYPNPFNPQTTFTLSLREPSHVRIAVYDVLGRQVAQLHEGLLSANSHTFSFDASHLASGTYLLRVDCEHLVETQRLLLLK